MRGRCLKVEIDNCETRERRVGGVSRFSKEWKNEEEKTLWDRV